MLDLKTLTRSVKMNPCFRTRMFRLGLAVVVNVRLG